MKKIKRNILLNPGPVTTTDSVKYAQVIPDICPREKEFSAVMRQIRRDLVRIVKGDDNYTAILFAGSGTAAMDACINSVVPPGKKIAIVKNGAYGERMAQIARVYGIPCVELDFARDKLPGIEKIKEAIENDKDIACLAVVHHETTTGILNPIKEIGKIAEENNCVFIVDTVSSFAGIPIDIKGLKIDFIFSTSNKCIQGLPGVAFVICKREELEKTKHFPQRSFYLNLYQQYSYFEQTEEMRFTAPVQVIYALRQAIKEYFTEGQKKRYERYTQNWKTLRCGLKDRGFKFLLNKEVESHILMTIIEPDDPNYNFDRLHDLLYKKGFTIYPGKLGDAKTFRLANIGAIDKKDIIDFLKAMDQSLKQMGVRLRKE